MEIKTKQSDLIKDWEGHCEYVRRSTTVNLDQESKEEKDSRIKRLLGDYRAYVNYYFSHLIKDEATGEIIQPSKFHISEINRLKKQLKGISVEEWARSLAKSTTFEVIGASFIMLQESNAFMFMVLVSTNEDVAARLLGDLQAELEFNQRLIADFGEFKSRSKWAFGDFVTKQGVTFKALGRGQKPRGLKKRFRRPDYIVIDDFDDDELVKNPRLMKAAIKWVKEALIPTVNPRKYRLVIIGNRISKIGLVAHFAEKKNVHHKKVNLLDRTGKPSWPERDTLEDCTDLIEILGHNSAQKEYFNNPITEGTVFKEEWIQFDTIPKLADLDQLVCYCDPSFTSSNTSDFKAIKFWGRKGHKLYLIWAWVRQDSVSAMVNASYDLYESLPPEIRDLVEYQMEANFIQGTLLDDYFEEGERRGFQLPIVPDMRNKPPKYQRMESMQPTYQRGWVFWNKKHKKSIDFENSKDQLLGVEPGSKAPDDSPDADEGAWFRLKLGARSSKSNPKYGKRTHRNAW